MKIYVFGSSITSCYWNGAATYYRGIYKNLQALGHEITFAEPDVYGRQQHRDLLAVEYADVRVYSPPNGTQNCLQEAASADIVIKHSGVGAEDELLEAAVLELRSPTTLAAFWDVDAPATLARVENDPEDPFGPLISQYDLVLTYGGGPEVVEHYQRLGARCCVPVYNGLDLDTHHPVAPDPKLSCDLVFVGNRLPDRERRVDEFFLAAALLAPEMQFILGGEGWEGKPMPSNVRWIGHVGTNDHNRVNCSARMVLNINRDSMASVGFSPPTRIFEAAGAAACVITDAWKGTEQFFEPGSEILVASSAQEVVKCLREIKIKEATKIGERMRARALREHAYSIRARQVHAILTSYKTKIPAAA